VAMECKISGGHNAGLACSTGLRLYTKPTLYLSWFKFVGCAAIWCTVVSYALSASTAYVAQAHTGMNLSKKLSYRRGTARRAMLVNSCYLSRGIAVRKVSNSKSDLQGHSRALTMVPFNRPHTISY